MIMLKENEQIFQCDCGCKFIWNEQDIKSKITQNVLWNVVICPKCESEMFVMKSEIKLEKGEIDGRSSV